MATLSADSGAVPSMVRRGAWSQVAQQSFACRLHSLMSVICAYGSAGLLRRYRVSAVTEKAYLQK